MRRPNHRSSRLSSLIPTVLIVVWIVDLVPSMTAPPRAGRRLSALAPAPPPPPPDAPGDDQAATIGAVVDAEGVLAHLGPGWRRDRALVIDREADLERLQGAERAAAEQVYRSARQQGIAACGEYSFSRTTLPLDSAVVRVFRFESAKAADAWRAARYETAATAPRYRRTNAGPFVILESRDAPKTIVLHRDLLVTCGSLRPDGPRDEILRRFVRLPGLAEALDKAMPTPPPGRGADASPPTRP